MDRKTEFTKITQPHHNIPPAQLWLGPHDVLTNQAQTFLQTVFCANNGCATCTTCTQIAQHQHHAIMWLYPEKQYTIETLRGLFTTITFALSANQHFFFVIQKADFLTTACANKLLKPIEEPPSGYHFILLAQRSGQLLPTIRSRCIIKSFNTTSTNTIHPQLFTCFTTEATTTPSAFLKILDQSNINERESRELLDALLHYWINKYKTNIQSNNSSILNIISIFKDATIQPPMPGSSKTFWRNLFLQMQTT